jgi:archaellum component FlaG (FlaF/FlaG flagellin family)
MSTGIGGTFSTISNPLEPPASFTEFGYYTYVKNNTGTKNSSNV